MGGRAEGGGLRRAALPAAKVGGRQPERAERRQRRRERPRAPEPGGRRHLPAARSCGCRPASGAGRRGPRQGSAPPRGRRRRGAAPGSCPAGADSGGRAAASARAQPGSYGHAAAGPGRGELLLSVDGTELSERPRSRGRDPGAHRGTHRIASAPPGDPASRLTPVPSPKLPTAKAAGWLLRNRRARPARRKSTSLIHLCLSCMCQSRKCASRLLSRHLTSSLLTGLYTFACGIAAYANTDGRLSRFRLGLLFLIGKFSCLCEALAGLPAAREQKNPKTQNNNNKQKPAPPQKY